MSEPTENELEEIWKFVNHYFGYCYPSDMVAIEFTTHEEFLKMSNGIKREYFNKMEIEAHAQMDPKELEAQNDAQMGFAEMENGEGKWFAVVFTDRLNRKNRMFQEFLRNHYSRKNYIEYLLIHEFTHILEHLTNKQLLTSPTLDLKIFLRFHKT
jgi:hypothetical protein